MLGTFNLLIHTPLRQLGLNLFTDFRVESIEAWHKIGDTLAPKNSWGDILQTPGMRNITMQGERPDSFNGHILVSVSPLSKEPPIIHIDINDHYVVENEKDIQGAGEILNILSKSNVLLFNLS